MNIKNILCPTDFSELASQAIVRASRLAKQHQARLHIIHIYEPVFTEEIGTGVPPADIDIIKDELEAIRPADPDVEYCHELIYGMPAGSIVGYANTNQIDLIVMGTHGRTGVAHLALGSVAESVVRWAKCGVLTVHQEPAAVAAP